jgi:hypothetical protein
MEQESPLPADQQQDGAAQDDGQDFAAAFAEFSTPATVTDGSGHQDQDMLRDSAASADDLGDAGGDKDQASPPAGAATPSTPEADVWANANDQQRAAWEAAQRTIQNLTHRANSDRNRVSALNRKVSELESKAPAAKAGAKGNDSMPADTAGLFDDPEFKAFKEEYPEVAAPLEKVISTLQRQNQELQARLNPIDEDRQQAVFVRNEATLAGTHPDWQDVAGSQAFMAWVNDQPEDVQRLALKNADSIADPASAAKLLTLFKAETGHQTRRPAPASQPTKPALPGKRERQLRDAAAPAASRAPSAGSGPPDDFEAAFKHFAAR